MINRLQTTCLISAPITKWHRLGGLTLGIYFLIVLETKSLRTRCQYCCFLVGTLLLACLWWSSPPDHQGQREKRSNLSGISSYNGTNPMIMALPLWIYLYLIISQRPFSKYYHNDVRASTYEFDGGGHCSVHSRIWNGEMVNCVKCHQIVNSAGH